MKIHLECQNGHSWYEEHATADGIDVSISGVRLMLRAFRPLWSPPVSCPYCGGKAYGHGYRASASGRRAEKRMREQEAIRRQAKEASRKRPRRSE